MVDKYQEMRTFLWIMAAIALLFFALNAFSKDVMPRPQSLTSVLHFGCRIQLYDTNAHWRTYVWIEQGDGKWEFLYSIRDGKELSKSMKDCNEWLKFIRKEITKQ